jgi:hypothetical protein
LEKKGKEIHERAFVLCVVIRCCCGDELDWTCGIKDVGQKTSILGAKFYWVAVLCRVDVKNGGAISPLPHTSS